MTGVDWETGQSFTRWNTEALETEWVVGYASTGISHLSLEYILIPVSATQNGVAYNPTGDTVQFAFMPTPTQVPGNTDWVSGSWETDSTNVIYPYVARCLVGPGGTTTLGIGNYIVYLKITDNPEIPVLIAAILSVS